MLTYLLLLNFNADVPHVVVMVLLLSNHPDKTESGSASCFPAHLEKVNSTAPGASLGDPRRDGQSGICCILNPWGDQSIHSISEV